MDIRQRQDVESYEERKTKAEGNGGDDEGFVSPPGEEQLGSG